METITYTLGQKLWFQGDPTTGRRMAMEVAVTKVGRKWVELDGGRWRVEIGAVHVDGGNFSSPGRLYNTQEEAELHKKLKVGWSDLCESFYNRRNMPKDMTLEKLQQIRTLLGIAES